MIALTLFLLPGFFAGSLQASSGSVADLVQSHGYTFEEHFVVTEDGYILSIHRIPYGKTRQGMPGRPVLLQHGILSDSAGWLLSTPEKGLGYILADQGYDVWMPNSRGNTYSRLHKNLSIHSAEYWDFSFHEMGYYDLPACIDYILEQTGHSNLYYIGHSQGTTIFFVLGSTRPEYNQKIVHMSALAPIANLRHTKGVINGLMIVANLLEKFVKLTGIHEILYDSWPVHVAQNILCKAHSFTEKICDNFIFLVAGFDAQQWNMTLLPIISLYTPAGTSVKQLVHFEQVDKSGGNFRQFDYGPAKNLLLYKQKEPPVYDVSKITTPVQLHYGHNDWLSGVADVERLNATLPNSSTLLVPFYYFNHLDFLWAIDVVPLLYKDMLNIMKMY